MPTPTTPTTPTIDVQIGEALRGYLSFLLPEFTVVRQYEDLREFLSENELAAPKAVLVLEGMDEAVEFNRTLKMDLRYTVGLYYPLGDVDENERTQKMDELMELNYRMANGFFQKFLPGTKSRNRITLLESMRSVGQMYDEELYRNFRIFGNEYSLVVQYHREVPETP